MKKVERKYYLDSVVESMGNSMIKVITGIRRCGKSYLLNTLFYDYLLENGVEKNQIKKVNLEEEQFQELLKPGALSAYVRERLKSDKLNYVFIDEVQKAPDFEAVLSGLNNLPNVDVYVTGSNSKFLSSDIITEFRGRGDEIRVHPFCFREFCQAKRDGGETDTAKMWREYMNFGGMPLCLSFTTEEKKAAYLKGLFDEVYFVDIKERYGIENDTELGDVVNALASGVGSLTNPHRLAQYFESASVKNITEAEIKKYIDCLMDAFLIQKAERYDIRGKKYLSTPSKYYYADVGLRNVRLNFRQQEVGHLMENIIYNELIMRGYNVDVGVVEANIVEGGRNLRRQYEIDFVCNQIDKRYYIQSAFALADEAKVTQETQSLSRVADAFQKIVVVRDDIRPYRDERGIMFVGLIDFLLKPEIMG